MSEDLPPPPAYEFSQQEFDSKTRDVLQLTESSSDTAEEQYEEWDDAVFDAAQALMPNASGPSSSGAVSPPSLTGNSLHHQVSIHPLHITKKNPNSASSKPPKEQPSWLEEAGLAEPKPAATYPQASSGPESTSSLSATGGILEFQNLTGDDEDRSIAPPPWAPHDPSRDDPPFGEVAVSTTPTSQDLVSNPPSPLASPVEAPLSLRHVTLSELNDSGSYYSAPPAPRARQSLPASRRPPPPMGARPVTSYTDPTYRVPPPLRSAPPPRQAPPVPPRPYMQFDPAIAYNRWKRGESSLPFQPGPELQSPHASFYNSAVTAYMSPRTTLVAANRPQSTFVQNSVDPLNPQWPTDGHTNFPYETSPTSPPPMSVARPPSIPPTPEQYATGNRVSMSSQQPPYAAESYLRDSVYRRQ